MTPTNVKAADDCASLVEQAIAEQRAGQSEVAERLYATALRICPNHPEANHNRAILLLQSGKSDAALQHFRVALENDADRELYWLSFARALLLAGRPDEAVAVLSEGVTHVLDKETAAGLRAQAIAMLGAAANGSSSVDVDSLATAQARAFAARGETAAAVRRIENAIAARPARSEQLQVELADLLAEHGDIPAAIDMFEKLLERNRGLAEAHYHLGSILSENGRVSEGFAHLMERAALVHSSTRVEGQAELAHKLKHDREQRAYLIESGALRRGDPPSFVLADGARVCGHAVNPANGAADLDARWKNASPRLLVFDDFLVPEALERLRRYCAGSTIWKRVYDAGYIGATPEDGFACPLLSQIVEEIQEVYQPILSGQPFRYLGAFKYDSELSTGTNTHADFSAVNVNLYITPDEANLAPDRGGMVIWDVAAQSEDELRYYNSHEHELRTLLEHRNAKAHHIPYRANRAIVFASNLFHRTDDCAFQEGYLNKRLNVSFLYGDWQAGKSA